MKLPHITVLAPNVARLGTTGITILFWTFFATRVSPWLVAHEYRHVMQWTVLTLLGAALIVTFTLLGVASLWLLPLSLLAFPLSYGFEWLIGRHKYNAFEIDADEYANRAVGGNSHQYR